jgi:hypothetical protein
VLLEEEAYSDVVREGQELVEFSLKGMLRSVGVDPPKWHDVGPLQEHESLFPPSGRPSLGRLAEISRWLTKERAFAFCGDVDFSRRRSTGRKRLSARWPTPVTSCGSRGPSSRLFEDYPIHSPCST